MRPTIYLLKFELRLGTTFVSSLVLIDYYLIVLPKSQVLRLRYVGMKLIREDIAHNAFCVGGSFCTTAVVPFEPMLESIRLWRSRRGWQNWTISKNK